MHSTIRTKRSFFFSKMKALYQGGWICLKGRPFSCLEPWTWLWKSGNRSWGTGMSWENFTSFRRGKRMGQGGEIGEERREEPARRRKAKGNEASGMARWWWGWAKGHFKNCDAPWLIKIVCALWWSPVFMSSASLLTFLSSWPNLWYSLLSSLMFHGS